MTLTSALLVLCVAAADFRSWTCEGPGRVEGVAEVVSVDYDAPKHEALTLRAPQPAALPEGVTRIRLWCARLSGDFELVLLVRDGSGREHEVRTFSSRPLFPALRRYQMADWSVWRQVESVNLAVPADWEQRVLAEHRQTAQKGIWPRPWSLAGLKIVPARQRRDNEAHGDAAAIEAGRGRLCLAAWDACTVDGFAAQSNWYLEGRWRWGWNTRPWLFLDDLTRGKGALRWSVEIARGYQGAVVWRAEESAVLDRDDPAAILTQRIELPELPSGRYWITTRARMDAGPFTLQKMPLWVAAGPKQERAAVATPFHWETGRADHVFPSETQAAQLVLRTAAELAASKGASCRVQIVDWRGQRIHEETRASAETIEVACSGLREGTDYMAVAEMRRGARVVDRAELHFGVASRPLPDGRRVPDGIPTRDELLLSRKAVAVAEHFGSLMSPAHQRDAWTPQGLGEFDTWLREAAGYGFKYVSFYTGWGEVEPLPGVYRWDEIERRVRVAEKLGMQFFLTPALWGDGLDYPRWLEAQPMLDQFGRISGDDGICTLSFWDTARRAGHRRWLQAISARFLDDANVIGYRTKSLIYRDDNQPEFVRADYSAAARTAFAAWLAEQGLPAQEPARLFLLPGCGIARFGPDLSAGWRRFMDFRIHAYCEAVREVLGSIRAVDGQRQVHIYRGPRPTACEAAIPLLADGAEFHDEGGPFYFQRAVESMCLQAGVPYTNEGHQFTPPSTAMADSTLFYGSCFDRGWYWLYRWNIHRAEDKRFAALPDVLRFVQKSMPAQQEWVAAEGLAPQVLVFGSRADGLLSDGRLGFYANISGVDVFTGLFAYHQLPAHFADEYCEWVDLKRFKLVVAVGEVMSQRAIERLVEHARRGGKLLLVGDAGRLCAERPDERDVLSKALAGDGHVRKLAADQEPPAPGAAYRGGKAFGAEALEEVLTWAGIERQVRALQPGFECLVKQDRQHGRRYVALFRRWPGEYENIWFDTEVARRWPVTATQVAVRVGEQSRWLVEKLHREPRSLGTIEARQGVVEFQADPALAGEMQLFRLTAAGTVDNGTSGTRSRRTIPGNADQ